MNSDLKKIPISFILKFCAMAMFMALVLWKVDYGIFWQTILSSNLLFVLLPVLIFPPAQLLATYRWHFLLKALDCDVSFWFIMRHSILGQFAALFLPSQLSGDVVRTIAVAKGQKDKSVLVLSVIIDKLSILIAIALFATLGILSSTVLRRFFLVGLLSLVIIVSVLVIFIVLCRYRHGRILKYISYVGDRLPLFLRKKLTLLYGDTAVAKVPFSAMIIVLLLGIGSQLVNTIGMFMLAYAMHIVISPIDWVAINAVVSIVQMVPISIGGLGIREGAFAGILSLYAVPVAQSTACSLMGFALLAILLFCSWVVLELGYSRSKWFMRLCGLSKYEAR